MLTAATRSGTSLVARLDMTSIFCDPGLPSYEQIERCLLATVSQSFLI